MSLLLYSKLVGYWSKIATRVLPSLRSRKKCNLVNIVKSSDKVIERNSNGKLDISRTIFENLCKVDIFIIILKVFKVIIKNSNSQKVELCVIKNPIPQLSVNQIFKLESHTVPLF